MSELLDAPAGGLAAGGGRQAMRMFFRNKAAVLGLFLLTFMIGMTLIGPRVYTEDPGDIVARPFSKPLAEGTPQLGTDYLGRDILAGIVNGGGPSLTVALLAAAMIVFIGVTVGSLAGYYGGVVDSVLMKITEFFQVLPALLFALVVITLFGPSSRVIAFAIGLIAWPGMARLTRAEFLRIKNLEFVKAARAIGSNDFRIMTRVVFPNALPPLIVTTTLIMGTAILLEAALAFLGLGDPNQLSWGRMIGLNRQSFLNAWWTVTFPGTAIFLTVLSFSLIGDGLQDAFNPKLRGR